MDPLKVDLVLKYAMAAASREEWDRRELGEIHLLKYVYLADLAYARRHEGTTFTGAPWRFYKFGPWTEQVYERIPVVLANLGAEERRVESSKSGGDFVRWRLPSSELMDE